jgi:hypothetical protein
MRLTRRDEERGEHHIIILPFRGMTLSESAHCPLSLQMLQGI